MKGFLTTKFLKELYTDEVIKAYEENSTCLEIHSIGEVMVGKIIRKE